MSKYSRHLFITAAKRMISGRVPQPIITLVRSSFFHLKSPITVLMSLIYFIPSDIPQTFFIQLMFYDCHNPHCLYNSFRFSIVSPLANVFPSFAFTAFLFLPFIRILYIHATGSKNGLPSIKAYSFITFISL